MTTTADANPPVDATVAKRVQQYVQIRDRLKAMDEAHDKARAPLVEIQNLITGWMQTFLETTGSDSVKTPFGTCYSSTRYSTSLADAEAFMKFVIDNEQYDMLDRRANATAVRAYVEENGALPPGVNLSALRTIGVRRAPGT